MNERSDFGTLDEVFSAALELTARERAEYLTRLAQVEPELAGAVEQLLARVKRAESFLGKDAETSRDSLLARSLESVQSQVEAGGLEPGARLGQYRIEGTIGRGLRSVVYLAGREEDGWTQQVAIKVLARGVNTDDVHQRFLAERQILTQLRYPGISILLDGGVTEDGLPYFVMEYIDGVPITDYCAGKHLDLDQRIALFRQVCESVAHAHRHLVVHRDIKPSNILVTGEGRVKLLDFGIAKLLEPPVSEAQYLTAADTCPMTPAYSSPEQFAGGSVTTATDVYQLGLLLAEMLTGRGPARQELGIDDRGLPARPPSKVKAPDELPYPVRELRGDLDWIVLRALEPAPEERYVSASELLADIERYQRDLPVAARTWTAAYVANKFIRRRPGMALAVGIAGVGLVGYAALVGYFNVSLERERAAAIEAAAQAEETRDLLIRFLTSPDPYSGTGADTKVTDLLLHSEEVLTEEFQHRPELQAELLGSLADVYQNLSLSDRAIGLRERELHTRRGIEAPHSLPSLIARRKLATARVQAGALQEALDELKVVLAELEEHHAGARLETARVKSDIGSVLVTYGDTAEARRYLEDAVQVLRADGSQPMDLAKALVALAYGFEDYATRLGHMQTAHELRVRHQGRDHPSTLGTSAVIAATLTDMGRYEESLELYEPLIPAIEKEFGPLHAQTLGVLNNRAVTFYFAGEIEHALEQHKVILDRRRQKHGNAHPDVAASLQNIGALEIAVGRHQEAISFLSEAAKIYAEVNLPGSPITAYPHISLAGVYSELDRVDELERHARRAIELLEGNVSDTNVALLKSQCLLGDALMRRGEPEKGLSMVRHAIDGMTGQTRLSPRHIEQCREILRRIP